MNVISEVLGAKVDRHVEQWISSQLEHTLFLIILTIAEYQMGIHHLPVGDKLWPRLQQAVTALEGRFSGVFCRYRTQSCFAGDRSAGR